MTPTERLRELLDERGVEWKAPASYDGSTKYDTIVGDYWFHEYDGRITVHGLTPEQAIAATLGRGTCHLEEIEKDCYTASEYMVGREWCFDAVYRCSCGCRFGHVAHNRPRFCPNCGRKVVDE